MAHAILSRFGSLSRVLAADPDADNFDRSEQAAMRSVQAAYALIDQALAEAALESTLEPQSHAFSEHLRSRLALRDEECLLAIYLRRDESVIREEIIARGSAGEVSMPIRSLAHRALDLGAKQVVLAHNHPSNNPEPSDRDIEATRQAVAVLQALNIALLDHFVVTAERIHSIRTGRTWRTTTPGNVREFRFAANRGFDTCPEK